MREIEVLIIDEHAGVRRLLARRLNAHPQFRVVAHTGDPLLGMTLAELWKPDVILVDLKGTPGFRFEVCRWIARVSPSSRLVVFTSYLLDGEKGSYLKAGVSKCLLKGMSLKALAQEISSLLRAAGPLAESAVPSPYSP